MKQTYTLFFYTFILLLINLSCSDKSENPIEEKVRINSFQMSINGKDWQPSIDAADTCISTYSCEYSVLDENPFYTIRAYKDDFLPASSQSKNFFILQIMNVNDIGQYEITEEYGGLTSYARFHINYGENQFIYENGSGNRSSIVTIDEFYPKENSSLVGLKGSFSGILYNLDNPSDSLIIDQCEFSFKRTNWNSYDQCEN